MSTSDNSSDVTSTNIASGQKVFDFPSCNVKFDGNNYLLWLRLVRTAIESGECIGFLTGEEEKPTGSSASK